MSENAGVIPNFGISKVHKFIVYVDSLVYLGSLFILTENVNVSILQNKSLPILIWGLFTWLAYGWVKEKEQIELDKSAEEDLVDVNNAYLNYLKWIQLTYVVICVIILVF